MKIEDYEKMDGPANQWVSTEDGSMLVGRDGQSLESIIAEINEAIAAGPVSRSLTIDDYKNAFDSHLDAVAQSKAYDNRLTIATYATSTNETYAAESQAFIEWRDEALASMFDQLAEVQGGGDPPTVEEFIANLPAIQWPEEETP